MKRENLLPTIQLQDLKSSGCETAKCFNPFIHLLWTLLFCFLGFPIIVHAQMLSIPTEYQSKSPYGNAETIPFYYAMTGNKPLTQEEAILLAEELPLREIDRFYGRIGANFSTLNTSNIRNESLIPSPYVNGTVVKKSAYRSQIGGELALGYNWEQDFRAELEALFNRRFTKTFNPALSNLSYALSANIQNFSLLANIYYDFCNFERFRPYLFAGVGAGYNKVSTTLNPVPPDGGSASQERVNFAWNLGLGFRVKFFTRWYVDIKYRFTQLGHFNLMPNNNFRLKTNYILHGFSVSAIYIF